jgi:hypothetical protein
MTTVLDIITDAMTNANVLADGETPTDSEGQRCLRLLNNMINSWAIDKLMLYQVQAEVFPLVASQQSYTMGSGGNFNTTRPYKIASALLRESGLDSNFEIANYQEYAAITYKSLGGRPYVLYVEDSYPLMTLYVNPVPSSSAYNIVLYSWKQLSSFANLTDTVDLPAGYAELIETNLTLRVCVAFNRPVTPELKQWADDTKRNVMKQNIKTPLLDVTTAIQESNYSNYNIYRGY